MSNDTGETQSATSDQRRARRRVPTTERETVDEDIRCWPLRLFVKEKTV